MLRFLRPRRNTKKYQHECLLSPFFFIYPNGFDRPSIYAIFKPIALPSYFFVPAGAISMLIQVSRGEILGLVAVAENNKFAFSARVINLTLTSA